MVRPSEGGFAVKPGTQTCAGAGCSIHEIEVYAIYRYPCEISKVGASELPARDLLFPVALL